MLQNKAPTTQCLKTRINYVLTWFHVDQELRSSSDLLSGCNGRCQLGLQSLTAGLGLEDSLPSWLLCVVSKLVLPVERRLVFLCAGHSVWLGLPHIMVSGVQRRTSWHWERERKGVGGRRGWERGGEVEGWGDRAKWYLSLFLWVTVHAQSLSHVPLFVTPWTVAPPGSSVHGIAQARILEWGAISYYRGSSPPRDGIYISCVSCIGRQILYHWATWEAYDFKFPMT